MFGDDCVSSISCIYLLWYKCCQMEMILLSCQWGRLCLAEFAPNLNNEVLFGLIDGRNKELSVVFGKSKEEFLSDDRSREILKIFTIICFPKLFAHSS